MPTRNNPRGRVGIMGRAPTLLAEAHNEFYAGYRVWTDSLLWRTAERRAIEILAAHGHAPDADLPLEEVLRLLGNDLVLAESSYSWVDSQALKWRDLKHFFHTHADAYLTEMERFDRAGPGSLEMNEIMGIPGYCAHEIHMQPGGYVGDPFAGHMYEFATSISADGRADQDQPFLALAGRTPVPQDGKVKRILDLGTAIGQYATALKHRFPDAEVWGLDIGAPMVRYAHMRAAEMGVGVNFTQRLAEATGFPDNHFDLVVSNILHHEVTAEGTKAIFREAQRILRPGGLYYPVDAFTDGPKPTSAIIKFRQFKAYRWNHEDWWMEWRSIDAEAEMKAAGLAVSRTPVLGGSRSILGGAYGRMGNNVVGAKT